MTHASRRLLIIDASHEDREFMRLLLVESGLPFRVDEAETGAAGLRACLENAEGLPDCILLDYNLPDYDAVELLAMLGGPDLPCCPVVVVTGSSGADYNPAILRLGALDFIGKGWMNTESLTRCVENAIERFGMLNSLRETEALRKSEESVRQYAEELESLMDSVPIAIFISRDPDCHLISGNRMANQLYENEPARNFSHSAILDDQPKLRRFLRNGSELSPGQLPMQMAAAQGVDIWGDELEVRLPGGGIRYCLNNARPLFDAANQVRGCIATVLDITERKRMEERLQQANDELEMRVRERTLELEQANQHLSASEARYRWLFDCEMIGIGYWRIDGAILNANDALLQLLGYDREDLLAGRLNWRSMTPPESILADEAALKELAERGVIKPFEKEYLHKDGGRIPVMLGVVTDSDQMDQGVFFVVDLTEQKKTEARMRRMSIELTLAEQRERKVIARELHDSLGQILHLLKIKLEPLINSEQEGSRHSQLSQLNSLITEASQKIRSLITQLSPPALSLGIIPSLYWLAEELDRCYGLMVEVECDGILPNLNSVQTAILFRSSRELLINTAKHSGVTHAHVCVSSDSRGISISVKDSGVGIATLKKALLGKKSFGLVSIQESISYLGGSMEVQTPAAGGTHIRIWIPSTKHSDPQS